MPVIFFKGRAAFSVIPVFTNISVITINGKSDGRTHSAHIKKPLKQQFTYLSGKIITAAAKDKSTRHKHKYFKRDFVIT